MSEVRKKLAIIDGKSVFYRGYYAMPNLSTKDGTPTGGVFGFATMALEVIKKLDPDYVCVAWDKPKTNIRKRLKLYPEYKAGRKPAPPDFYEQIPLLHELLDAFGWPLYELDDYEADDIMGTLAVQAAKKGIEVELITSDLDMLQLIDGYINVYAIKRGFSDIERFKTESFEVKYKIQAGQFLDYKSLAGDSSDNIPGVPKIGPVAATKLLQKYKTLDGIYENIELIDNKIKKLLVAGKDLAYLSKKLAQIWTDAPIKLDLNEVDGSKAKPEVVRDVLQKLEFRTLAQRLPQYMHIQPEADQTSNIKHQTSTSGGKVQSLGLTTSKGKNILIDSKNKLKEISFAKNEALFVHSRCAGRHGKNPELLILSDTKTTYTIYLSKIPKAEAQTHISFLISHSSLIGYDTKYTLKCLLDLGIQLPNVGHDVLLGAFLLNSLRREQTLTELATSDLGYEGSPFEDLTTEELAHRAPEIIEVIGALYKQQKEDIAKLTKVAKVAKDIDWPIIPVLAKMEYEGIQLDADYLKKFAVELEDSISDLEQQIYGHANQEFNIASPAQLAEILFVKLNLPKEGIKRGKTGYSTAASELDKLRGLHPIIDLISQFREVSKLKNTYVDTLPNLVDENSRVHTTFALTIAQTGRLSSSDPNLQNIPVKTDLGKHIRTAFVAGEGNMLVGADYSQFELRIAAMLCGDETLIDQFNRDIDVHVATAALITGRDPEDVTKQMRRDAKVVNFGVMYGLSPHGLTAATGMTHEQAKHFIDRYFEVRPKLLGYIESVKEKARNEGYSETYFGRRRPTPDVHSSNFVVRESAMRAAVNMPFQGTAADIMKMAMVAIDKKLVGNNCKMLLQIHDSVLVECPADEAESTAKLLKETMENVVKLPVKLTVDTAIGKNWGEL